MVNINNSKILVTGGSGFIGSNFIELINNNYYNCDIINIDKLGVGSRTISPDLFIHNNYKLITHDISDSFDLDEDIDYIFHFAAESHVDRSINSPIGFIHNNVIGISNILEWMRKRNPNAKMINISTDEVYGHLELNDPKFTVDSKYAPRSPYSASKASADLIANAYSETYGLWIITTHCCNNFGPHQHFEKFIPTIIKSIHNNKKIPVYGNGQNIREWIYVDDHNKSLLDIIDSAESGKVYNIGSGIEYPNLEIIKFIMDIMCPNKKLSGVIEYVEDRRGHDFRYAIESYDRKFELSDFELSMQRTITHYISLLDK